MKVSDKGLLAVFMGATPEQWYSEVQGMTGVHYVFPKEDKVFPDNQRHHSEAGLKYDTDWNWLMPVIDKIENLNRNKEQISNNTLFYTFNIYHNLCYVYSCGAFPGSTQICKHNENDKIISAYKCVIDFIKMYNEK